MQVSRELPLDKDEVLKGLIGFSQLNFTRERNGKAGQEGNCNSRYFTK